MRWSITSLYIFPPTLTPGLRRQGSGWRGEAKRARKEVFSYWAIGSSIPVRPGQLNSSSTSWRRSSRAVSHVMRLTVIADGEIKGSAIAIVEPAVSGLAATAATSA